ncbi:MAG: nitroreductase family protein [Draconibacterium sp.]
MKKGYVLKQISKLIIDVRMILTFCIEANSFFWILLKHNASSPLKKTAEKLQYLILRETHVIEKGMSMKNPRKGFGQEKVDKLLEKFLAYSKIRNDDFLLYPLSAVKKYIDYSKSNSVQVPKIEESYNQLIVGRYLVDKFIDAGVKTIAREDIWMKSKINFKDFVQSRHSIRYFSEDEYPNLDTIKAALKMAQRTPSACNRQAWRVYVFGKEKTLELLTWQGGARGFESDIPMSILVTADLNGFLHYEPHQPYVDGGMYTMTLIYALHSLGLGTIPLSTGFASSKVRTLYKKFNIPKNEVPIVIIGVGCLKEEFNVAVSHRNSIDKVAKINI